MHEGVAACGLAVGFLLGCGASPAEVVGVYEGKGSSSGDGSSDGTNGGGSASTGPVADGSASSGSSTTSPGPADGTTMPVDPVTTDASTGEIPPDPTTSDGSTGDPSTGAPPAPTCDELFGLATSYVLCWEDETSCGFSVNPGGLTCTAVCNSFGAACIDNFDNPSAGEECVVQATEADCNSNLGEMSTICVCAK